MTLHWRIDSREKLVTVVADGNVELGDVERVLDCIHASGVLGYRKLFDGTLGETRLTAFELLTLGARIRALHAGGAPLGPVALVLPKYKRPPLMRLLGIMAAAPRPLRMFGDLKEALRWLGDPETIAKRSSAPIKPRCRQRSHCSRDGRKTNLVAI